ncbi:regulator of telomere elongation helicase 1 homolog isoform X2 [Bacillus rossius redtenbacheri]|uniref:regulator of telomere elongation helicase 1 homolog isoform X2 n=1 Tax=Bacillus rossius redtenbacheri TaxID=93214 RepID=UPI002FDCB625
MARFYDRIVNSILHNIKCSERMFIVIKKKMTDLTLGEVTISFPFKPYDVQGPYMEKVIQCLQQGQNGVLESPTGTGKTLSLLCSSLAWLTAKKAQRQAQAQGLLQLEDGDLVAGLQRSLDAAVGTVPAARTWGDPRIIYASRTHADLTQAVQELKRTRYAHVKVAVLGSRDQMCIHPEMKTVNVKNKDHFCRAKVNSRSCHFYNNVDTAKESSALKDGGILDIEDLVRESRKLQCCPYYIAKAVKDTADIVFMPYNYLLDPKTRHSQGIDLFNTVIILDEAHYIPKMCEEAMSFQICSTDIESAITEITQVMECAAIANLGGATAGSELSLDELSTLKTMLVELGKEITGLDLEERDTIHPGSFVFDLLSKVELTCEKSRAVVDLLEKAVECLSITNPSPYQHRGVGLLKFQDLLKVVFCVGVYMSKRRNCHKVYVTREEVSTEDSCVQNTQNITNNGKVINYWCLSPGFGMQRLADQGVRCVLLTSGTLSPLNALVKELCIPVPVTLENPHVIRPSQVCVGIVEAGPDGVPLDSSYHNRDNQAYVSSLGRTILNLSRLIPHGLLVFFPSYIAMRKCQEAWQKDGLWTRICNYKHIIVEPRTQDGGLTAAINDYYVKIADPNKGGACFMAVAGGKGSEDLDFADRNVRGVIFAGIPFPSAADPRVVLKRGYLDESVVENTAGLSGNGWYRLEASRAVNQALGRVVRHAQDYGAILLCDMHYSCLTFTRQLSSWVQPHVRVLEDIEEVTSVVKHFFAVAELPAAKITLDIRVEGEGGPGRVLSDALCGGCRAEVFEAALASVTKRTNHDRPRSAAGAGRRLADPVKVALVTEYLREVEKSLDSACYKKFMTALKKYTVDGSMEDFFHVLKEVFLPEPIVSTQLLPLLQRFHRFVMRGHKKTFEDLYMCLEASMLG